MTGKAYYMTTLGEWQRHAARFANSHFIVLDSRAPASNDRDGGPCPAAIAPAAQSPGAVARIPGAFVGAQHAAPGDRLPDSNNAQCVTAETAPPPTGTGEQSPPKTRAELSQPSQAFSPGAACCAPTTESVSAFNCGVAVDAAMKLAPEDATTTPNARILVLIEADEGVHLSLEDEPAFEALPHPLAQKPISDAAQAALAPHGVAPGATTFDAAETVARVHPLLRHRVF